MAVNGGLEVGLTGVRREVHDSIGVDEHVGERAVIVRYVGHHDIVSPRRIGPHQVEPWTRWPALVSPGTSVRPMRPAAPVTTTRTRPQWHAGESSSG